MPDIFQPRLVSYLHTLRFCHFSSLLGVSRHRGVLDESTIRVPAYVLAAFCNVFWTRCCRVYRLRSWRHVDLPLRGQSVAGHG